MERDKIRGWLMYSNLRIHNPDVSGHKLCASFLSYIFSIISGRPFTKGGRHSFAKPSLSAQPVILIKSDSMGFYDYLYSSPLNVPLLFIAFSCSLFQFYTLRLFHYVISKSIYSIFQLLISLIIGVYLLCIF